MATHIQRRDMFWFAVFRVAAVTAVALFAGCAGGPSLFASKDAAEIQAERETRMHLQLGQARLHEQRDQPRKAREIYERMVLDFPDQGEPFHRLAVLKDENKEHGEAQRLYVRALQLDPRNAQLCNDLGYSYFLSGNLTEARQSLQRAVALDPSNNLYRNNLGMTLGHMRLYQEALDEFVRAGGIGDAYYNLAFVYSTQGQFDQAKECFRHALRANPQHEQARVAYESFERFERHPELADAPLPAADSNGNWQPYKEGGGVEQVGHQQELSNATSPAATESVPDSALATQQQMQARASALMQRKMAGMRENTAVRSAKAMESFGGQY